MFQKMRDYRQYILPFALAAFLLAFFLDSAKTLNLLKSALNTLSFLSFRFVLGFAIAYAVNFLVAYLRRRLHLPAAAAIATSYIFLLGLIAVLMIYIVPMVMGSITKILSLINSLPQYYYGTLAWLEEKFSTVDEDVMREIITFGQGSLQTMLAKLNKLLDFSIWENLLRASTRLFTNILFAIVISIYALGEQTNLAKSTRRFLYAVLPIRHARAFIEFVRESNRIFSQFIVSKIIDSVIIGLISAVIYTIFKIPEAAFFAVLAGVTNVVPYFGPMVGGAIAVFILLFYNPWTALTVLIIVVIVQTFDGYYLGPKLMGDAVGISPLLTIIAISLGGDLLGFTGILLGVPAMAVLKTMVYDRRIAKMLKKRRETSEQFATDDSETDIAVYDALVKEMEDLHNAEADKPSPSAKKTKKHKKSKPKK